MIGILISCPFLITDVVVATICFNFSAALFDNSSEVKFKHIYEAVRTTKAVYPDVIKKELIAFKEEFKEELQIEGVIVETGE